MVCKEIVVAGVIVMLVCREDRLWLAFDLPIVQCCHYHLEIARVHQHDQLERPVWLCPIDNESQVIVEERNRQNPDRFSEAERVDVGVFTPV